MNNIITDPIVIIIILAILIIVIQWLIEILYTNCNNEKFGALQSLYSNDGIQDAYLTKPVDRGYYDPYKYWRGIPWHLPTRNLQKIVYYPYLYEYNVDRYSRPWPYW